MKKFLFLGIGSALMFTMGGVGPASADAGPHSTSAVGAGMTALTATTAGGSRCASCHRAHTAQGANLLKQAQPALCFSCHGSLGSTLDVVDGVQNADNVSTGALRGGGFEYALIDGAGAAKTMGTVPGAHGLPVTVESVPVLGTSSLLGVTTSPTTANTAVTSSHQIDGTTQGTMWGNGAISAVVGTAADVGKTGVKLECGSCHDPHGNGNYRILRPLPIDSGTQAADLLIPAVIADPSATPPVLGAPAVYRSTTGVNIPDALAKNYTTTDYWSVADRNVPALHAVAPTLAVPAGVAGVPLAAGATDGFISNVAAWCTTCHTRYYAPSGSAGVASGDAVFSYRHASNKSDKAGVSRPNCIQCHVSHGSNVTMTPTKRAAAVPFPGQVGTMPDGTLAPTDAGYGDSKLLRVNDRGTCVMCHNV